MIPGVKSTEFYVVAVMVAVWAARYLGFDLSPEQVQSGAVEIAKQLQGIQADNSAGFWLAAIYTAGRTILKLKGDPDDTK